MKQLLIGIDVGSTTTKITVLNKTTESLLYSDYRRHHADQLASVLFAIRYADMAEDSFHQELLAEGERILKQVTEENRYAVIPASRPYQNDPLVNHNLPEMFTSLGIPVLTADAFRVSTTWISPTAVSMSSTTTMRECSDPLSLPLKIHTWNMSRS